VTVTFTGAIEIPAAVWVGPVPPPPEFDVEPQAARPTARTASNIDERKLVFVFKFGSLKITDFYRKETSSSAFCQTLGPAPTATQPILALRKDSCTCRPVQIQYSSEATILSHQLDAERACKEFSFPPE
jgi:hypothetical protein